MRLCYSIFLLLVVVLVVPRHAVAEIVKTVGLIEYAISDHNVHIEDFATSLGSTWEIRSTEGVGNAKEVIETLTSNFTDPFGDLGIENTHYLLRSYDFNSSVEAVAFNINNNGAWQNAPNSPGTAVFSIKSHPQFHWVATRAVPEPTSFALFGLAMFGLANRRRKS